MKKKSGAKMTGSARKDNKKPPDRPQAEYILFFAGERRWALPTAHVRQTFELDKLTPVPLAPAMVLGLTNLHGEAIPLIDLAALFDDPTALRRTKGMHSILVDFEEVCFALIVQSIDKISRIPDAVKTPFETEVSRFAFEMDKVSVTEIDVDKLIHLVRVATRRWILKAGLSPAHQPEH